MRLVDADHLIGLVNDATILGDGFKQAFTAIVKGEPTIEERKTGKWILTEDDDYEYCTCSECGYQNGENWMIGSDIPFCAMCGADMRGDDHENG